MMLWSQCVWFLKNIIHGVEVLNSAPNYIEGIHMIYTPAKLKEDTSKEVDRGKLMSVFILCEVFVLG